MNTTVKRTIFGVLFLAIMLGGLLFHPIAYSVLFLFMTVVMMWEFYRMSMGNNYKTAQYIAIALGACLFLTVLGIVGYGLPHKLIGVNILLLLALMIATILEKDKTEFKLNSFLYTGILYIAAPLAMTNFVVFREGTFKGILMVAFFCIIWASDVGAYCFGMLFGQKGGKKLFPSISPKKSWAGFWGGMLLAMVAGLVLYFTTLLKLPLIHCLIMALIMHVAGVFGDLFESQWKRTFSLKDSGHVIPGHGGLMDRFDSALFAIPAGVIYMVMIGLFEI
jgi:phosphatidate cytidylyltransferase